MAYEQTVTIVNNSGKIISTGKQILNIFKDAKSSYDGKKAQLKSARAQERALKRAQTYDETRSAARHRENDDYEHNYHRIEPRGSDERSQASSRRSHRSRRSTRDEGQKALTAGNLKTLTEVSATAPSKPPQTQVVRAEQKAMVPRRSSEPCVTKKSKDIDMDLAYGSLPPDLEERHDLDAGYSDEQKATDLIHRVEDMLDEAQCIHHTANTTIAQLQQNPNAAAAVAITLAELSAIIGKMSPGFLGVLKSASPAVFSLLASPQFLIGTGIAAGITVVMFGGWKIVQKLSESTALREALEGGQKQALPANDNGMDEALVVQNELSSIESWRRGIHGEMGNADTELRTPKADKQVRDEFDTKSRHSTRTSKTSKTSSSHKSHRSKRDDSDKKSVADSERSHRSKRSSRVETRPIDEKSRRAESHTGGELVLRPKATDMIKSMFKKNKAHREMVAA